MNIPKQTINKIKGTIYGQVIGDALGLGAEFMSKASVKENYPKGLTDYDQIVQDYHRSKWEKEACDIIYK
jgi:ADP-ribosylglycohydrolase